MAPGAPVPTLECTCRYLNPKAVIGILVLGATALLNLRIKQTATTPIPEVRAAGPFIPDLLPLPCCCCCCKLNWTVLAPISRGWASACGERHHANHRHIMQSTPAEHAQF